VIDYQKQFFDRLVAKDMAGSMRIINAALEDGTLSADTILLTIVSAAMDQVGRMQLNQMVTLSEVYMMAAIGDSAIDRLLQELPELPHTGGTVVLGSAEGDYHSLGRKIVGSFLRVGGFRVVDLGASVPAATFVDRACEEDAFVIGVSALLLHTAEKIKEVRDLLDERRLSSQIKLMVGGAAFNFDRQMVRQVGADGMALNALGAVAAVRSLNGQRTLS
jgi:methanogenic corrinoid protein MtbC1